MCKIRLTSRPTSISKCALLFGSRWMVACYSFVLIFLSLSPSVFFFTQTHNLFILGYFLWTIAFNHSFRPSQKYNAKFALSLKAVEILTENLFVSENSSSHLAADITMVCYFGNLWHNYVIRDRQRRSSVTKISTTRNTLNCL